MATKPQKTRKQPLPRRRAGFVATLLIGGMVMVAMGGFMLWRAQGFVARALPAEAVVTAFVRDPALYRLQLRDALGDPRLAARVTFTIGDGAPRSATLGPEASAGLAVGDRVAIRYDPQDPTLIRGATGDAESPFAGGMLAIGGLLLGAGLLLARRRPPAPPAPKADDNEEDFAGPFPKGKIRSRHAIAGRPLLVLEPPGGGLVVMALERTTGAFLRSSDILYADLSHGKIDADDLNEADFRKLVRDWREDHLAKLSAQALVWRKTEDAEFPFAGEIGGRPALVRINDFPAEPLLSIIVEGQNVGNLEEWPAAWAKP